MQHYARTSALPAIAAALALSSTPVFAQDAPSTSTPPVASEPAPTVATDPAPAVDSTPVAADPVVPEATTTKTVTKRTTTAAKTAPKVATRTVTQKVTRTAHAAVPAAAGAPVATAAPAPAPTTAPAKPAPVVDLSAKSAAPAPAPTAKAEPANGSNETAMELGGGALALIAIGAGAYALSRRRRHEDDEIVDEVYEPETTAVAEPEPEMAPRHDPVVREEPAMIAPEVSAFSWGNQAETTMTTAADDDDGSDRNPGESWVERAYRGPSPANPSVSLRARLKRAAFFDKREREVAAGKAEPVDTDAGLPDAMVEEQERELA